MSSKDLLEIYDLMQRQSAVIEQQSAVISKLLLKESEDAAFEEGVNRGPVG